MAFSFGIISALIAARKKRGQSRLQQVLAKQKKEVSADVKLYQFPTKILFSICFLLLLSCFMEWFRNQFHIQLATREVDEFITFDPSLSLLQPSSQAIAQVSQKSKDFELEKVNKTINIVHFVIFATLAFLSLSLQMRMVKCSRKEKYISSVIYKYFGLKQQRETYNAKQEDKIFIWQMGESRFSNTNYYFSVRIGADASWQIIRKSNIYDSKVAAIKIATTLGLPFSIRIAKVGPTDSYRAEK